MRKINLSKYRGSNSRVLSGREQGKDVRRKLNLDEIDYKRESVMIIIPEDTLSLNTSFFLGLFGASVRTLGEDEFRKVYQFECKDIIRRSIDDGIIRALKNSNPLG